MTKTGEEGNGKSQHGDAGTPTLQSPRKKSKKAKEAGKSEENQKKAMETQVCRVSGREWPT